MCQITRENPLAREYGIRVQSTWFCINHTVDMCKNVQCVQHNTEYNKEFIRRTV